MKNVPKIWLLILLIFPSAPNCQGKQQQESADIYTRRRLRMVKTQIQARGVKDTLVLNAMKKVPRHLFVPENLKEMAYWDRPLPIGEDQTISQPYIVAFMTEKLKLKGKEKVLEIGTGSGYQAAVLAEIAKEVYTIEIIPKLGEQARARLESLGYKNVRVKIGDGYRGWPEHAPFDAIIVTAAPDQIPQPLIQQLKRGGSMIIPVGDLSQNLFLITKDMDGTVHRKSVLPVIFVPMTGEAQKQPDKRK
ncbi:MAG: protein-L-isoaspartate(D-aspartate) O-methyltransferase [Calditrichaeota bacterium]|nr:protein-L-isoaspartate(D-aspartate) O-methyltransferase [Calditrichota bacterium]